MDSLAGHFLIASPAILDPNFERAVVLITAHNDEGAVGVILNRCSAATVGEAVPQLAPVIDVDDGCQAGAAHRECARAEQPARLCGKAAWLLGLRDELRAVAAA